MPKHDVSNLCQRIRSIHPSSLNAGGRARGPGSNTGAGAARSILICCRGLVPEHAVQRRREDTAADGDASRLAGLDYWVCADDCHACKAGLLDQGCGRLGRISGDAALPERSQRFPRFPPLYKTQFPMFSFLHQLSGPTRSGPFQVSDWQTSPHNASISISFPFQLHLPRFRTTPPLLVWLASLRNSLRRAFSLSHMFTKAAFLALSFLLPPRISGAPADLMFTTPHFEILLTRGRLFGIATS
jgi:hypothetical protein